MPTLDPVKHRAEQARYSQSEKGKVARALYRESDEGLAAQDRYGQSELGKVAHARYDQSELGKAKQDRHNRSELGKATHARYIIRNPEKRKAQAVLQSAVAAGRVIRPLICSCPIPLNGHHGGRPLIEAHHYLGYELEHYLDVIWVCQRCHQALRRLETG